jgi:hypothetical protein
MNEKFEKNYNIAGKDLTPEKRGELVKDLEYRRIESMKPIEGEYLKSPEEFKIIKSFNKYLNEEQEDLGIKDKVEIVPEQIHLLPKDVYNRMQGISSKTETRAIFSPLNQKICIDKDHYKNRLNLYKSILHESIHAASFSKFIVGEKEKRPPLRRSGYHIGTLMEDVKHEYFEGLNEMIADETARDILTKHRDELRKELNITSWEERKTTGSFYSRDILHTIIEKIADKNNEEERNTWTRFKRGLFTGEMMHLREMERTFGKGSLRVLAAVECGTKEGIPDEEAHKKALDYFQIDNEEERDKIANEILAEEKLKEYKKQRK